MTNCSVLNGRWRTIRSTSTAAGANTARAPVTRDRRHVGSVTAAVRRDRRRRRQRVHRHHGDGGRGDGVSRRVGRLVDQAFRLVDGRHDGGGSDGRRGVVVPVVGKRGQPAGGISGIRGHSHIKLPGMYMTFFSTNETTEPLKAFDFGSFDLTAKLSTDLVFGADVA